MCWTVVVKIFLAVCSLFLWSVEWVDIAVMLKTCTCDVYGLNISHVTYYSDIFAGVLSPFTRMSDQYCLMCHDCFFEHPLRHVHVRCEKAPVSFVMYVCPAIHPSVHVSAQLPLDRFSYNFILVALLKSVKKVHIWLQSEKNIGHFTCRLTCISYCCHRHV